MRRFDNSCCQPAKWGIRRLPPTAVCDELERDIVVVCFGDELQQVARAARLSLRDDLVVGDVLDLDCLFEQPVEEQAPAGGLASVEAEDEFVQVGVQLAR